MTPNHCTNYGGGTTGGNTISYEYDDSGNRLTETVNGDTTAFLNDPNQAYDQVLEQYAPGGVLAATYIRGLDLLFQDRGGAKSYYVKDNLGSTRALTNFAGAITDSYTFDAYGNLIGSTGVTVNAYLFTGQWFDASIGQYYQRARYYEASAGRFTSRDTYGGRPIAPITLNLYAYAGADPAGNVDPSGHDLIGFLAAFGARVTLGALEGAATGAVFGAAVGAFDAYLGNRDVAAGAVQGLKWGAIFGGLLGGLGPLGRIFLGPPTQQLLASIWAGGSLLLGGITSAESFYNGNTSQGFFRLGLGFLGAYLAYSGPVNTNRPVNIGGEGEVPGALNVQGQWALDRRWGSSIDGESLASLIDSGNDFLIYKATSRKLPFGDESVPTVYTNNVPIDLPQGLYPPISSLEIKRILRPGGQWIRDGEVVYTKPGG